MTRRPWYRTTPLHLMDSNPRDEEPDEPVEDDEPDEPYDADGEDCDVRADYAYDPATLNRSADR